MSKIHMESPTACTLKSHPCPTPTARGAHTKNFTQMWSGHCSSKTVHQLQLSQMVSRGSASETTPATIQQEFCPHPKTQFTQEGKNTRATALGLFLESAAPFSWRTSSKTSIFLRHNRSYTFYSEKALIKKFFLIKFPRWATFYCRWQQHAENNGFTPNSTEHIAFTTHPATGRLAVST